ncbi:hypothetical protein IOQ59_15975, partial [Pontibacterium sp. N1Y112]|nr:hypothetical protein [Pontibacterium sinense]
MQFFVALLLAAFYGTSYAAEATQVNFTLEGCRLEKGDLVFPGGNTALIPTCTEPGWTTGNLGKNYAELDWVPHRVTLQNNNGNQTYSFLLVGDHFKNFLGWDKISVPVKSSLSDASCPELSVGPELIETAGSIGGVNDVIYRVATLTQPADTTCIYDYAQRLGIGASQFSGSSLQSALLQTDFSSGGIGERRIQLPVNEILPQELDKDMHAEQDVLNVWNLTKETSPVVHNFGDTCWINPEDFQKEVRVTIDWTVTPSLGGIEITTNIKATNPSHRTVFVEIHDEIWGDPGTGDQLLDEIDSPLIKLEPNSNGMFTHSVTLNATSVSGLRDIASATYFDSVFPNEPLPGVDIAEAFVDEIAPGDVLNATAIITDVESISGAGLSYSVDSLSAGSAAGTFQNGYVQGTETTNDVTWVSDAQSSDGFVEFNKTVYLDHPRITSGTLSDIATLDYGDPNNKLTANAHTNFSSSATTELTIEKMIDDVLTGNETVTFKFDVDKGVGQHEIVFNAGDTTKTKTLIDLAPGTYSVLELATAGFSLAAGEQNPQSVDLGTADNPVCEGSVSFFNEADPANVQVVKVTLPAGNEAGWQFTLTGPGLNGGVSDTTDVNGHANFGGIELGEGLYTMTELSQTDWDLTDVTNPDGSHDSAECTFEVDLPADAGHAFECTFENTQRGQIIITKVTEGNELLDLGGTFSFSSSPDLSLRDLVTTDSVPTDTQTVSSVLPGQYLVSEDDPALQLFALTDITCDDGNSVGDDNPLSSTYRQATINVEAGETVECVYTNTKLAAPGSIEIRKISIGGVDTFGYNGDLGPFSITTVTENVPVSDTENFVNLPAGEYVVTENDPSASGYHLSDLSCVDDKEVIGTTTWNVVNRSASISIDDGEHVVCTFTNTKNGQIIIEKQTDPDGHSQVFNFTSDYGAPFGLSDNQTKGSGDLLPGTYSVSETVPAGWKLDKATCDDGSHPNAIELDPGETVKCTFYNRLDRGQIIIEKQTDPDGHSQVFNFTSDYGSPFGLSDNQTKGSGDLLPGTYSVSETVPAGWKLDKATCDDGSHPNAIELDPGETVKCTFYNRLDRGQIIIEKQTDPDGHSQVFNFTSDYGSPFGLSDNQTKGSGDLLPGTYSV